MKIGDLAAGTGTPVETIRFYEREGLLPHPSRTAANYRLYNEAHVQRLTFIRRCRSLDMTLDEVRALLRLMDHPERNCVGVNALLDEHIGHVAQRIAELRRLERELRALRSLCNAVGDSGDCGILNELRGEPDGKGTHAPGPHRHVAGTHTPPGGHRKD